MRCCRDDTIRARAHESSLKYASTATLSTVVVESEGGGGQHKQVEECIRRQFLHLGVLVLLVPLLSRFHFLVGVVPHLGLTGYKVVAKGLLVVFRSLASVGSADGVMNILGQGV